MKPLNMTNVQGLPSTDHNRHTIVRLHNSHIDGSRSDKQRLFRRDPVVITNRTNGAKIIRYAMGNARCAGITKQTVALDYDGRDQLGLKHDDGIDLEVRRARAFEVTQWFWGHDDLNVRLSTRLAVLGFFLGVTGLITGIADLTLQF